MESKQGGPNMLITGTPGTGKSTLCSELVQSSSLQWINIGEIAEQNNYFSGYDDVYKCPIIDEEKVLDELEDQIGCGGNVVDYHGCDFFPKRWFDIVFVLRTDNTLLYDRLINRGQSGKKLEDNIQCEIFQSLLEEAREAFPPEIVHELPSNTPEDIDDNVTKILQWVELWQKQQA